MTKAEFLTLPEGPPDFEFEHGELIPMPRPHSRHQDIATALARVLQVYVARNQLGRCWVEIDVELNEDLTYVPDLVFLTTEHLSFHSEKDGRIRGVPDLVIEIVSRSNPGRDRVTKFNNYLAAGVPWYWLIDTESLIQEEYHAEAGRYSRTAAAEGGEIFRPAAFPGLALDLKALLEEQGAIL
ncbi:MAG: Uma2 family endonuclease [Deltaproteobacteria bacterium]|nr:Uma2 family endonuclease [Deltaproteobacteria bacterium]